jgi:DNA-directed RNA polymerase specialized sigma24 family protein
MQALKPDHRTLVEDYYDGREPASKLAASLNISVDAFYKILQRSRKALFDCLRQKMALETDV